MAAVEHDPLTRPYNPFIPNNKPNVPQSGKYNLRILKKQNPNGSTNRIIGKKSILHFMVKVS